MTFDLRSQLIQMHGIQNADLQYSMYLDETNNIAKLRLNNGKFNVSDNACFALGGIATLSSTAEPTLNSLTTLLGVPSNVPELKFKHIGKGDFTKIIAMPKVEKLLDWLLSQNYFVHYQIVDPLYWGIVDTIDSAIMEMDIAFDKKEYLRMSAKSDLHRVIQNDLLKIEPIFTKFEYPNVKSEKINAFYKALIKIVGDSNCLALVSKTLLIEVLRQGQKLTEVPLLGGEPPSTLLESFDQFYAERIMLFENATLVFDNEDRISERLAADAFKPIIGTNSNYKFIDSKLSINVQISDLIIGVIGRYFSYLNISSIEDIDLFVQNMDSVQRKNITALKTLIDRSDNQCGAFFHYIVGINLLNKHRHIWQQI